MWHDDPLHLLTQCEVVTDCVHESLMNDNILLFEDIIAFDASQIQRITKLDFESAKYLHDFCEVCLNSKLITDLSIVDNLLRIQISPQFESTISKVSQTSNSHIASPNFELVCYNKRSSELLCYRIIRGGLKSSIFFEVQGVLNLSDVYCCLISNIIGLDYYNFDCVTTLPSPTTNEVTHEKDSKDGKENSRKRPAAIKISKPVRSKAHGKKQASRNEFGVFAYKKDDPLTNLHEKSTVHPQHVTSDTDHRQATVTPDLVSANFKTLKRKAMDDIENEVSPHKISDGSDNGPGLNFLSKSKLTEFLPGRLLNDFESNEESRFFDRQSSFTEPDFHTSSEIEQLSDSCGKRCNKFNQFDLSILEKCNQSSDRELYQNYEKETVPSPYHELPYNRPQASVIDQRNSKTSQRKYKLSSRAILQDKFEQYFL